MLVISAGIYKATGFVYADPIASVFVGGMIIGTAWPLLVRSGKNLLNAAPDGIDIRGVREDIERISGSDTVHDLHVWSAGELRDTYWASI
jgi:zinc transporter 1